MIWFHKMHYTHKRLWKWKLQNMTRDLQRLPTVAREIKICKGIILISLATACLCEISHKFLIVTVCIACTHGAKFEFHIGYLQNVRCIKSYSVSAVSAVRRLHASLYLQKKKKKKKTIISKVSTSMWPYDPFSFIYFFSRHCKKKLRLLLRLFTVVLSHCKSFSIAN